MWYIGVDGALAKSGVVALGIGDDPQQVTPYDEIVIQTRSDPSLEARLHLIRIQFNAFIKDCLAFDRRPIVVAIEAKFMGVNAKQFGVLSKVDAVFGMASYDFSAEAIFHVEPTKLKKFVCETSYRIGKPEIKEGVYKMWGYERTSSDRIDAYALAHYARCVMLGTDGGYRGWQADVVAPHAKQIAVVPI